MSTIAHVLEAAGIATVALSSIKSQVERAKPPRSLYCDFPLGRPLGKPNDAAFQKKVMKAAFAMLDESEGPVLRDFPETIVDASQQPLSCPLPPLVGGDEAEAVREARGLEKAYQRSLQKNERTLVGRAVAPSGIPDAIAAFVRIAEGTPWKDAGMAGHPLMVARDITSYYEEAASALVDHVPAARSAETWFFQQTKAGGVLKQARQQLRQQEAGFWFYLIPFTQDS